MAVGASAERGGQAAGCVVAGHRVLEVRYRDRGGITAYRAVPPEGGSPLILRVLTRPRTPELTEHFLTQVRVLRALEHPGILPVQEAGESAAGPFVTTKDVDGVSLRELIDRGGMTPMRAVRLLGEVADALDTAHSAGLVHGDVRPETIMLQERPVERALLVDFPLVPALRWDPVPQGQAPYAAPERARGDRPGAAADIYSLTCVLYECFAATTPFGPTGARGVIIGVEPPPLAGDHPELAGLDPPLARGLARAPADRPAGAALLMGVVARALIDRPPTAQPDSGDTPRQADAAASVVKTRRRGGLLRRRRGAAPLPPTASEGGAATLASGPESSLEARPERDGTSESGRETDAGRPGRLRRASRVAALTLASLAVAAAAGAGGWLLSDETDFPRGNSRTISANDLSVDPPEGWSQTEPTTAADALALDSPVSVAPADGDGLTAGLVADRRATLDPNAAAAALDAEPPRPQAVRLGEHDAYRWRGLWPAGAEQPFTLFVTPTSAGALAALCPGAGESECARAASTLRVKGAQLYDPAAGVAWRNRVGSSIDTLSRRRLGALGRLSAAGTSVVQADEAAILAAAHRATARRIGDSPAPPQAEAAQRALGSALRDLATAYDSLRGAAVRADRAGYERAAGRVRRLDAALRGLLRGV